MILYNVQLKKTKNRANLQSKREEKAVPKEKPLDKVKDQPRKKTGIGRQVSEPKRSRDVPIFIWVSQLLYILWDIIKYVSMRRFCIAAEQPFLICVWYFPRFKTFRIKAKMLRVKPKDSIAIIKLGTSNFINHSIMMLVNIVMNNTLTHYGALTVYGSDIPLAVSGVVAKLNSIMAAFCVGFAQGYQPIHSFNMGAKNYARIKETYKKAIVVALMISVLAFLLFQIFPLQIISIFGSGDELYFEFAEHYLRIFMMMICVYGVQPLTVNYFTGIDDAKRGIMLSLSHQGCFLIPLLIALPMIFGLDGVLYSGPIADALACALSLLLVARSFKRLTTLQQSQL